MHGHRVSVARLWRRYNVWCLFVYCPSWLKSLQGIAPKCAQLVVAFICFVLLRLSSFHLLSREVSC